ncbi:MAG: type II secretion system protein [Phycisphaeraceae bacterium]|nr:type II secretion system protein [Phycisphaeraceae bacterium]
MSTEFAHRRRAPGLFPAAAFTVVEMLVVIAIITILLLVTVPSFNAMMYSSEQSLSENQVRSAARAARDVALRSPAGRDSALVFIYEPTTQRTVLTTYVKVGTLRDADPAAPNDPNRFEQRDVFVPARDAAPITLPRGWMVRGLVAPGFIDTIGNRDAWYAGGRYQAQNSNWVFPETGFFDPSVADAGQNRHTYIVRFEAGTGLVRSGSSDAVLLYMPSPDSTWRNSVATGQTRDVVLKRADDAEAYVQRVLGLGPSLTGGNVTELNTLKRRLLGRESTDMVLARPVSALAVYDESRLAAAFNSSVNRVSGSVYRPPTYIDASIGIAAASPQLLDGVEQASINRWIQGDTDLNSSISTAQGADRPEARIFTIDRYTGSLRAVEVQP